MFFSGSFKQMDGDDNESLDVSERVARLVYRVSEVRNGKALNGAHNLSRSFCKGEGKSAKTISGDQSAPLCLGGMSWHYLHLGLLHHHHPPHLGLLHRQARAHAAVLHTVGGS